MTPFVIVRSVSDEAIWAGTHYPKVVGSNPTTAIKDFEKALFVLAYVFCLQWHQKPC